MLPIRLAVSRRVCEASLLGLTLFLGGVVGPLEAGPLPPLGVDDFRELIDPRRTLNLERIADAPMLVEYRRKLQRAARDLPTLGEVSRVLLMPEWSSGGLIFGASLPLTRIRKTVLQEKDEDFLRDVQRLMADFPEDRLALSQTIVAQIQREVRLQLLDRLENRIRFFLGQGRTADRIAAANLIGDTMSTSRSQDISQYYDPASRVTIPGVMATQPKDVELSSYSRLRERLRVLSVDLEKLLTDPDVQVQVAGIRALGETWGEPEKDPAQLVAILKPVLASPRSADLARQAAAEALAHVLEVISAPQINKGRPEPYLKAVEQVLPVAAASLSDSDPRVRRASLEACQQAALMLIELADVPEYYPAFRPTLAVVDKVLPKINASAGDRIPELCVGACHVLETFAMTVQKMYRFKEGALPIPIPEPSKPSPPPSKERGTHKPQTPPPILRVQAVNFYQPPEQEREAPKLDELPPPIPVEDAGIQGTVRAMIANLKHADYRVRLAAVDTLETFGNRAEEAIPALAEALRDSNKFVRWSSVRTLGRLSPRRADVVVPGLMRLLDDREDPSVRIAAAKALEQYGEHAKLAVPLLARVINRGDKEYILAILHTIQGIGTDAAPALPNVAWILEDRSQPPSVRIEAAQTLGRFGALARNQLPILLDVMHNETDEDVRNAASSAVLAVDRPFK